MGLAIEINGLRTVKNSVRLLVKLHDFRLILSFTTDLKLLQLISDQWLSLAIA